MIYFNSKQTSSTNYFVFSPLSQKYFNDIIVFSDTLSQMGKQIKMARLRRKLSTEYYGLSSEEATKISNKILSTVKEKWESLALKYGIGRNEIEYMRPAFYETFNSWKNM